MTIVGNAQANTLMAASVGSYLDGSTGADKLYGNSGADTYAYSNGGGADQIFNYNYEQGDVIKIDGTVKSSSISGKNVVLKVGSGSITVSDVVDKLVTLNINGSSNVYKFDKTNATLAKAATNAVQSLNQQLPTEDYWFDVEPDDDPLGSIVEDKDMALNTLEEFSIAFDDPKTFLVDGKKLSERKKTSG